MTAREQPPRRVVLVGDAVARLRQLPAASIDAVVTSPPYFALRSYGVVGELGAEASVQQWVDGLRTVMAEVTRVLAPHGTVWLNLGDSYSKGLAWGAPPKSLLLGPERLLLGLADDGWLVRNKVVWAKSNPMPTSVRDRLAASWEPVYLLTRQPSYYFDLDAIRVPHTSERPAPASGHEQPVGAADSERPAWMGPLAMDRHGLARLRAEGRVGHPLGKNPGDVWRIASSNYRGPHFATFPEAMVEPCLRATCPLSVCDSCRRPWRRTHAAAELGRLAVLGTVEPSCVCGAASRPGVVLDPFFGAGTVGVVAERLGLDWLGIELNPDFAALAEARITGQRSDAAPAKPQQ